MTARTDQHLVPASVIGRFGASAGRGRKRLRKQMVERFVPHRGVWVSTTAERCFRRRGQYDAEVSTGMLSVDGLWDSYEPLLPSVLAGLDSGDLPGEGGERVMLEYLAGCFARHEHHGFLGLDNVLGRHHVFADARWTFECAPAVDAYIYTGRGPLGFILPRAGCVLLASRGSCMVRAVAPVGPRLAVGVAWDPRTGRTRLGPREVRVLGVTERSVRLTNLAATVGSREFVRQPGTVSGVGWLDSAPTHQRAARPRSCAWTPPVEP